MSREDFETVRRGHDTFNRRDLDAYLDTCDPEMEFTPYERAIDPAA
jgi:ketosteroid isomerase-like protein